MKFKKIRLNKIIEAQSIPKNYKKKLVPTVYEVEKERENEKTRPHVTGFYYFPETKSDEQALEELKSTMIKFYNDIIKEASEKIQNIVELDSNDIVKCY